MIISIIVAVSDNNVIGINNSLPWDMPADLQYFKKNTLGKPIIMGYNTFKSIGKGLPGRKNIVLSRDDNIPGCETAHSIEEALQKAEPSGEVMIAGGASVYSQFLPLANRLYLTFIHHDFEGDSFFPEYDKSEWKEVKRVDNDSDKNNPYSYSFVIFEKNVPTSNRT